MADEVSFEVNTKPTPFEECVEMIAFSQAVQTLVTASNAISAAGPLDDKEDLLAWAGIHAKAARFVAAHAPPKTMEDLQKITRG